MKRPKHMTMSELIALPVVSDRQKLFERVVEGDRYGGAFRDQGGCVWGTLMSESGWVRYPAYLSLLN